jgi:hypothetical protein
MKEFFLFGILCTINPMTGVEQCAYINEAPIVYYYEKTCKDVAVKKVNEIGINLTKSGVKISQLRMTCIVDNSKVNT